MKSGKAALALCAMLALTGAAGQSTADIEEQVRARETAFAKTMADRDHAAFVSMLDDETVWSGGRDKPALRGKKAVADAWKKYYEGKDAPFSWKPDTVWALDSGTLVATSGPVFDPEGKRAGTFNSVWRKNADGQWKIIFDNGCPRCDCGADPAAKKP